MDNRRDLVLMSIGSSCGKNLFGDGRNYLEVNIGEAAAKEKKPNPKVEL